jgi:hypothetical protein
MAQRTCPKSKPTETGLLATQAQAIRFEAEKDSYGLPNWLLDRLWRSLFTGGVNDSGGFDCVSCPQRDALSLEPGARTVLSPFPAS